MNLEELLDQSAITALGRAAAIQHLLREAERPCDAAVRECQHEMHQLVGDIVSLRNAAELLKREFLEAS